MQAQSEWLTGVRIERLKAILFLIPSLPAQLAAQDVHRVIWKRCGGPWDDVPRLIGVLSALKLIRVDNLLKRTPAGDKLARALRNDSTVLGLTLIRAGHFYDQARMLLETGRTDDTGGLHCSIRSARTVAPQLVAIVEGWAGVTTYPELRIAASVVQELNSVWALLPPAPELPKWAAERKEVGNRAEMYTVQLERTQISPSQILWVARDSDAIGFDVEDVSINPSRCIEVKGRRDNEVVFYLSDEEWRKAQILGERYEIHFWGGIDLSVQPSVEYSLLRASGYPFIFKNPAAQLGITLKSIAVKWKFSLIETDTATTSEKQLP